MPKDETYIIDLCDEILAATAERHATFPFLLGDIGKNGERVPLPVDAYYPDLNLVVEYLEVQHFKSVPHWDNKPTISGTRGEQRRRYDERRRLVMKAYGIKLVELDYSMFNTDANNRLMREPVADKEVVRKVLDIAQ